eukprot:1963511-Pyramimonas_sp.AAC.1
MLAKLPRSRSTRHGIDDSFPYPGPPLGEKVRPCFGILSDDVQSSYVFPLAVSLTWRRGPGRGDEERRG